NERRRIWGWEVPARPGTGLASSPDRVPGTAWELHGTSSVSCSDVRLSNANIRSKHKRNSPRIVSMSPVLIAAKAMSQLPCYRTQCATHLEEYKACVSASYNAWRCCIRKLPLCLNIGQQSLG